MGYTTLGTVLKWIERPAGVNISTRREEAVDMVNRIREHFYYLYQDTPLFLDVEECIQVQEFCADCQCEETYTGITLPSGFQTPEAMFRLKQPIPMYSRWREYRVGVQGDQACDLQEFDMGSIFSTERDITCGLRTRLGFWVENPIDCGKVVRIAYRDASGNKFEEQIALQTKAVLTERSASFIEHNGGVVLPTDLKGRVYLAEERGRILSVYTPDQHVPTYRRLKLTGVSCEDQILVKAARKFVPLYDDMDVVETDNRNAFESAARHFYFIDNNEAGTAFEQKAEYHGGKAKAYLLGEKSRENGKQTIKQFWVGGTKRNRTGLRSRRGGGYRW